jgi:Zn-dependent protease
MNWSWHAFTIFRIPVRLHWTLVFVVAYWLSGPIRGGAGAEAVLFTLGALVMNFGIILFHELGHCWATRRVGGHVDQILLWPLGGFAYVGHSDEPRTDIFVAFSGPATHILLGGLATVAIFALGVPWNWGYLNPIGDLRGVYAEGYLELFLIIFLHVNASLFAFNLFVPAFPLDGGRILLDYLRIRMGDLQASRVAGTISLVIGVIMLVAAILLSRLMLGFIAVMVLLEAMRLRMMMPESEYSSHGYSDRGYRFEEPRKEGFFQRRRRQKRERALARRDAEEAVLRARVDELLDKVNRGGINSLSPSERKTLEEASARLRKGGESD